MAQSKRDWQTKTQNKIHTPPFPADIHLVGSGDACLVDLKTFTRLTIKGTAILENLGHAQVVNERMAVGRPY